MPADVFYPDRYFNTKDYLNSIDPFRKTTPVGHKIPKWIKKYGTKQTLKYDENGEKIRYLKKYYRGRIQGCERIAILRLHFRLRFPKTLETKSANKAQIKKIKNHKC